MNYRGSSWPRLPTVDLTACAASAVNGLDKRPADGDLAADARCDETEIRFAIAVLRTDAALAEQVLDGKKSVRFA